VLGGFFLFWVLGGGGFGGGGGGGVGAERGQRGRGKGINKYRKITKARKNRGEKKKTHRGREALWRRGRLPYKNRPRQSMRLIC